MKITDIITHVLSAPLDEPFASWGGKTTKRSTLLIEVVTDEGITGWGSRFAMDHSLHKSQLLLWSSLLKLCLWEEIHLMSK